MMLKEIFDRPISLSNVMGGGFLQMEKVLSWGGFPSPLKRLEVWIESTLFLWFRTLCFIDRVEFLREFTEITVEALSQ